MWIVDYDDTWPKAYERLVERLIRDLGTDQVLRIVHFGSTAIPGMSVKPVIGIMIESPSFEEGLKRAIARLCRPEW